ncbi:MAG: FtsX-like permease family protein [Acidimicrobiia bacterium]
MFSLTIKSIRARKMRFALTGVAVMLGVAFMTGTLVLTDTIERSYDDVAGNVYKATDAVVRSSRHVRGGGGPNGHAREVWGTVDDATLAAVRSARGVRAAEPRQADVAVVVGRDGRLLDSNPNQAAPIAMGWQQSSALNPMRVVAGHAPRAADEVVVDARSARTGRFAVGDPVRVLGATGVHELRLAGIVTYGDSDSAAGAQVVAFTPATAASVFGTPGRYQAIQVVASRGVSQTQLVENLKEVLRDRTTEVITGAAAVEENRKDAGASFAFVNTFLMVFAIVALVVGSFVIYNTFSITVVQRTRETALLRAIGARRKQVTRSVLFEAALTGVLASVAGVLLGTGTAHGLRRVLEGFGVELPPGGIVVQPSALTTAMLVGVVVTLVAAYLPARKAAKTAPIDALRDVAVERRGASWARAAAGLVTTGVGAASIAAGLAGGNVGGVGLGALAVFVGVAMLGPVIASRFARVLGWPLPRLRGVAGALARENAARNPKRTSATASALMIGVGLVALITVFAASARSSISAAIDTAMRSEFIVNTRIRAGGLSPEVARRIDALPETGPVTALRFTTATIDGEAVDLAAFDTATMARNGEMKVRSGDVSSMGTHDVALEDKEAKRRHLRIGDPITVSFAETGPQPMRVAVLYGIDQPLGKFAISMAAYDANFTTRVDSSVMVPVAPGVSTGEARHAIEKVLSDYPTAKLLTRDGFKGSVAAQIDNALNLVYVLLAMALIIAFFGIANALTLSVHERTRELGVLRALGMARGQVRSSVRWESVLVALLGTTLGIVIGLGFSWALVTSMRGEGFTELAIPGAQLAGIAVVAAGAAVVAAALPARRAARLDVLRAIGD